MDTDQYFLENLVNFLYGQNAMLCIFCLFKGTASNTYFISFI